MKPHHFIFRGLVLTLLLSGIATPVNAQTSAHNQRVARVRADLKELQETGPIRNWGLEDDIRIWSQAGYRDIPDADLDIFEREIARERMLRQQQADQKRFPPERSPPVGSPSHRPWEPSLVPYPGAPGPPSWGDPSPLELTSTPRGFSLVLRNILPLHLPHMESLLFHRGQPPRTLNVIT